MRGRSKFINKNFNTATTEGINKRIHYLDTMDRAFGTAGRNAKERGKEREVLKKKKEKLTY